jgi:hypothetical protein
MYHSFSTLYLLCLYVLVSTTWCEHFHPKTVVSGAVSADVAVNSVVYETQVTHSGVSWIRLKFSTTKTVFQAGYVLRVVSVADGHQQEFKTKKEFRKWMGTSAYFNGDTLKVQWIVGSTDIKRKQLGTQTAFPQFQVTGVYTSAKQNTSSTTETLCSPNDRREPAQLSYVGRLLPKICTAWLIDDKQGCLLTAGHCARNLTKGVVQFHVPSSGSDGEMRHPSPRQQYPIDVRSLQYASDVATGNDWMYFGTHPNLESALTPRQAIKDTFKLFWGDMLPVGEVADIQITGYGRAENATANHALTQHTGEFFGVRTGKDKIPVLTYTTDTTKGDSGSAILDTGTRQVIGIHTTGGCSSTGGYNYGTLITHPPLQEAIRNPRGVCAS